MCCWRSDTNEGTALHYLLTILLFSARFQQGFTIVNQVCFQMIRVAPVPFLSLQSYSECTRVAGQLETSAQVL